MPGHLQIEKPHKAVLSYVFLSVHLCGGLIYIFGKHTTIGNAGDIHVRASVERNYLRFEYRKKYFLYSQQIVHHLRQQRFP